MLENASFLGQIREPAAWMIIRKLFLNATRLGVGLTGHAWQGHASDMHDFAANSILCVAQGESNSHRLFGAQSPHAIPYLASAGIET